VLLRDGFMFCDLLPQRRDAPTWLSI
jgi:hypothetical protein